VGVFAKDKDKGTSLLCQSTTFGPKNVLWRWHLSQVRHLMAGLHLFSGVGYSDLILGRILTSGLVGRIATGPGVWTRCEFSVGFGIW